MKLHRKRILAFIQETEILEKEQVTNAKYAIGQ